MDNEAAFDKFKQCAVEVLQVDPSKVTPEARSYADFQGLEIQAVGPLEDTLAQISCE